MTLKTQTPPAPQPADGDATFALRWVRSNLAAARNLMKTSVDAGHGYDNFRAHDAHRALTVCEIALTSLPQPIQADAQRTEGQGDAVERAKATFLAKAQELLSDLLDIPADELDLCLRAALAQSSPEPVERDGRLLDLLAVIHRDGGHYVAEHGLDKAVADAMRLSSERIPPVERALDNPSSFQDRVQPWMLACFGPEIAADRIERNHRFLEEALELVQALGCTQSEAHQLVDYVFGRSAGEPGQEVGGVRVTLAALCLANGLSEDEEAERELARIWTKVEQIRAKQAAKPKHSPLPQEPVERAPEDTGKLVEHGPLLEKLRRTKTQHRVRSGFAGFVNFPDENETREVPVNPDGPEAATLIERLEQQRETTFQSAKAFAERAVAAEAQHERARKAGLVALRIADILSGDVPLSVSAQRELNEARAALNPDAGEG